MHGRAGFRRLGALLGALGVALAAYGAHGLSAVASDAEVRLWGIACALHLLTAPVILIVALHPAEFRPACAWLLLIGVVLFCGSLYAMALGAPRFLGAVAPLGGLSLIAAWGLMSVGGVEGRGRLRDEI
jgi:uncharacterized membrane protein YgdD (TMEM256/DUF423 family)